MQNFETLPDLSHHFDCLSDETLEVMLDGFEAIGAPDMPQGSALFEAWNAAYTQKIMREGDTL